MLILTLPLPRLPRPNLNPREMARFELDRNLDDARRVIPWAEFDSNRKGRRRERIGEVDVFVPGAGVVVIGDVVGIRVGGGCLSCAGVGRVLRGWHLGVCSSIWGFVVGDIGDCADEREREGRTGRGKGWMGRWCGSGRTMALYYFGES